MCCLFTEWHLLYRGTCPMPHTRSSSPGLLYNTIVLYWAAEIYHQHCWSWEAWSRLVVNGLLWAGDTTWFQTFFPPCLIFSTHHREKQLGYKLASSLTLTNVLLRTTKRPSPVLPIFADTHSWMHLAEEAAASRRFGLSCFCQSDWRWNSNAVKCVMSLRCGTFCDQPLPKRLLPL